MPKADNNMLSSEDFYQELVKQGVTYFCGVPDSLVSPFSLYLEANAEQQHAITANEGNAIGLAIGYNIATDKVPLVYMQNSGLNNALDPLVSLVDSSVLSIPILLLISWRGQPGTKDEPQHDKQGVITPKLLKTLGIPYVVLSSEFGVMSSQVRKAVKAAKKYKTPYALIVQKNTFASYDYDARPVDNYPLSREDAIKLVIDNISDSDLVVASNGKISRELFEYRNQKQQGHDKDLLVVGGMGHASSIALGVALQKQNSKIFCLDGDGSVLMHMGSLATIGTTHPDNFTHIILNNGVHDSVGGQPTVGFEVDLVKIAKACGYANAISVQESAELISAIEKANKSAGPNMIEIRVRAGARHDLTRPSIHPADSKKSFMKFLENK